MSQPEPDREALDALVAEFRAASGYDGEVDHFAFADTPEVQTELAQLVLAGPKRATAGLHDDPDGDAPTEVGQHDAVLDGDGAPVCIIRTDEVRALPFRERDPAFAWDEGEGDRTLADWTDIHERYFERYLTEAGGTFGEDTLVSFQRISVVWPEVDAAPPLVADGEVFDDPAPVPDVPRRTEPTQGHILVEAVDGDDILVDPTDGTAVQRRTDATGRAGFTWLDPGTYEVRRGTDIRIVTVTAGQVTRVDLTP